MNRIRHRLTSTHRRLRTQIRRIRAEQGRADHTYKRTLDMDAKRDFDFDTGSWTPVLDAGSFNGLG